MESQMRLADRRGLLQGAYLSQVQEWAVEMLIIMDNITKAKDFADSMRARLVAAHPSSVRSIFPEWFEAEDPFAEAKREDGTYDIDKVDDASVNWTVPSNNRENDELERWIHQRMTVSAADLQPKESDWQ